jgi:type II secretory pathway pseudopilin PulG
MAGSLKNREREAGLTLIELVITMAVWSVFLIGTVTALAGAQRVFVDSQELSELHLRAQRALDRIASLASQAVTTDAQYTPLKTTSGIGSHCLRFRILDSVDGAGQPTYDDNLQVFIYGPDSGTEPSSGLIVGRGPDLATIHATGSGADGLLGTVDDDTTTVLSGTIPAVELLLPDTYAPQTGTMLTIDISPPPNGRLITFTLRLNKQRADGSYLIPNDLVLTERIALRQ